MDRDSDNDFTRSHVMLTSGMMISHYRIFEKIGAGGMGEVYLAEDTKLGRRVAMKFLPSHLVTSDEVKTRFVREAQTLAKLNHPNIVSVYEVSEFQGRPYYVMELVEGESLHMFAHERPLPFDLIIEYAIQICQGLGEAHRAGIVHRDIKASNIIVDSKGRIRILDFGLAAVAGDEGLTRTGSTLGTVSYMSPEQVSGREIDNRSDLFSLGIVLYELVAGRNPFKRENEGATLKAIIEDIPEPLTRYRSNVPDGLQGIVMKLLEKDKEIRFQSAEGVIADLKRLMYDSTQSGYSKTMISRPKKKKYIGAIVSCVLIAAAIMLLYVLGPMERKSTSSDKVPTIAVLPFENLGLPEDQFFADGMTEEITSRLAGISGLGVISRTSSEKIQKSEKTLQQIGRDYGVNFILEGSVRWNLIDDHIMVRITPQLIRVSDDHHIWADNYERELMDVFVVQADIAEKIVDKLGLTLTDSDRRELAGAPTDNPEAYRLYLTALQKLRGHGEWSETSVARQAIDSAVVLDPSFALAHALRAELYSQGAINSPESEYGKIALKAAETALDLEPGLAQAQLALGKYCYFVKNDIDEALRHFDMAKSELYNDPELLDAISDVYLEQGRREDALEYRAKAARLDPLNDRRHKSLAEVLGTLQRFGEQEQSIDRAIALRPDVQLYYEDKIESVIARTGDIEKVKPIIIEALMHCDTTRFITRNSSITRFFDEFRTDSIISEYIQKQMEDTSTSNIFHGLPATYFGNLDILEGYKEIARKQAEQYSEDGDFVGWRGLLLSFAGECEEAIKCGLKNKELVEKSECTP